MAIKTVVESIRDIQEKNAKKTQGEGRVTYVDPIGKTALVQVSAGSAPVSVRIPSHIDANAMPVGSIALVDLIAFTLTGIVNGQNKATETLESKRTIIDLQQQIARLETRIATLEAYINEGSFSRSINNSLSRMFSAGAGNMTGEDR